jgi:phage baseplate assembly protein V
MAGKATVENVDDSSGVQQIQASVLQDEVLDQVERAGCFGITSNPKPGAFAVILFPNGNRDTGIVIATEDQRYRPTDLNPGEVAVYDSAGNIIHLKSDGSIEVATSQLTSTGDIIANGISLMHHTHSDPQGGSTGQPIG